ncbi:MAG: MBL fold metallo-hydrolase [Rhodospirillaceae bacterium]|nr:MBL fold metallo-hydrolase [Rhodospirillaceae bacterium]
MVQYPFTDAPAPGQLIEVAPAVNWLRMPLPFALNHINLWVLGDGDAVTLVDTGVDTSATRELWGQIFAGPLAGKTIERLICTHFHPDHMGLAGWLKREYGIAVHMTPREYDAAKLWHGQQNDTLIEKLIGYLISGGIPEEVARTAAAQRGKIPSLVSSVPEAIVAIDPTAPIMAGGLAWRITIGEGHAPQLVTLFNAESKVLISSDQILPQISPNISVSPYTPDANPLKLFIDGFARFRDLPEDTLVLPSHRMPFHGLHTRIEALIAHHHDRLEAARTACAAPAAASPVTAFKVMAALFPRTLDAHQTFFALGETVAHLNYLMAEGQVVRTSRADGAWVYRAAA